MFKSHLLVLAALMCCQFAFAQQYPLTGTVRDAKTKESLLGATVELQSSKQFAVTDQSGKFQFDQLISGTYNVVVRFVGYATSTTTVTVPADGEVVINLEESATITDEVIVYSTRANENSPTTFSTVEREEITKQNFGQDLPYLLNWTPSLVSTSDAGTGIGYTGVRIRGSDATAINVTINGIPYNDSESLGTFWVDIPDIASSSQSVQIQRGVGTSTNGAGAFGATINLQTNTRNDQPYAVISNSVGVLGENIFKNYNSRRHTLGFGTGLINNHWVVDGRVSKIASEGFIDRATADLNSYYFAAGFYAGKTMLKGIIFGGKERTYQAWYGVPESRLNNDVEAMFITAMNEGWNEEQTENLLKSNSRTFNPYTYKNQVDDYRQDHYQIHFSQIINDALTANISLHYTPGKGYYEEFKPKDKLSKYGLENVVIKDSTIERVDLIRRRWLDNDFYGFTYSLNYAKNAFDLSLGGGWNRYEGKHYGQIIWAEISPVPTEYQYYYSTSDKKDFNIYLKTNYAFTEKLNVYLDLQQRRISYIANGLDNGGTTIAIDKTFGFFNPKFGATFETSDASKVYASFSIGNREPMRSDFINAPAGTTPKHETLQNIEAGYRIQHKTWTVNANYYFMDYKNQLIHTGKLNDVGAPIRTNVKDSYRTGIELEAGVQLNSKLSINGNVTLSKNKIRNFTEALYDYGLNWDEYNLIERVYKDTDIAFSPSLIAGAGLTYRPLKGLEATLLTKYVSRQYLDNTANKERSLDAYTVNDLRLSYSIKPSFAKEIQFSILFNNLFSEEFESNGYTWGYLGGGEEYRENYYFPQAGRNLLAMLTLRF